MGLSSLSESNSSDICSNTKVMALESSLQQSVERFKDLILDLEQLHIDSENHKQLYLSVKDKCEKKSCIGAEELKKVLATKDQIIQSVASTLTKLNETKNFDVLADAFKILFDETTAFAPTEVKENPCPKDILSNNVCHDKNMKKEATTFVNEEEREESLCEIDGTPTGRKSPIIHTKKTRSILAKSSDFRDKKKCPDEWPTPNSKAIKLLFPTSTKNKSGNLRQSRLNVVTVKHTSVVDLTCSPEILAQRKEHLVQPLIKKESFENDDTILPSPTSDLKHFSLLKTNSKASPIKFKKPGLSLAEATCSLGLPSSTLSLKNKSENITKQDENKDTSKKATSHEMEESIKILNPLSNRLRNKMKKEKASPVKIEVPVDVDATHCDINTSSPLMQHVDRLEEESKHSPAKRPLADNINIMNTPPRNDPESSMSILQPEPRPAGIGNVKRKLPELVEPIYKEQTVRSKAEKRNLQGWSCEECKNFYGELYKNDPVMLAKKINECSKHRGKHNPARPKTPPNFWNPRWEVPEDTEELNRMNNAI